VDGRRPGPPLSPNGDRLRPWHERANPISNFFGCKTKYRHVEFDDKIGVDPFMNKYKVDLGTTSQWTTKKDWEIVEEIMETAELYEIFCIESIQDAKCIFGNVGT
jgi:hypothetical protein